MTIPTWERDKREAEEFQDFVRRCLWRDGLAVDFYGSRKFQVTEGEGPAGLEVKLDRELSRTGNLYIEFSADTSRRGDFRPSGIERDERIWLWAIGNLQMFAVVQKSILRSFHASGGFREAAANRDGDVPTKGFLLPWRELEPLAGKIFVGGTLKIAAPAIDAPEKFECASCRRLDVESVGGLCPDCAAMTSISQGPAR